MLGQHRRSARGSAGTLPEPHAHPAARPARPAARRAGPDPGARSVERGPGRPGAGPGHRGGGPGPAVEPAADRGGGAHLGRRRAARPRRGRLPGRRRGRDLPGMGNAALRAGEPRRRDHGPSPAGDVAARASRRRTGAAGDRRPGAGAPAAPRTPRRGRRAGHRRPRRPARPRPSSWPSWSAAGYRREYQVEHRGELAVRGSIVDVFPSTADTPVRIDLWGDEVDRLTEFGVADQRSIVDIAEVEVFPCRELLPTDEVAERAEALGWRAALGPRAVGAAQRGPHLRRHGVVAAVAHRGRAHPARPARPLGPGAPGRAAPHARPRRRHPGRGGRPGRHPRRHLGRGLLR